MNDYDLEGEIYGNNRETIEDYWVLEDLKEKPEKIDLSETSDDWDYFLE